MRRLAASLCFLAGCESPVADTDAVDSAGPAVEDTGDSAAPVVLGEADATFSVVGSYEGSHLSLTWVDPVGMLGGQYGFGDVLASEAVTEDELTLALHAPDASLLRELDPDGHPGVKGAFFVPAIHLDTDGDGLPSATEAFLGVSKAWLLYVDGSPSGIQAVPNALRGWNAMLMDMDVGIAQATSSLDYLPIFVSLNEHPNETVRGTWSVEPDSTMRIVVRSRVGMEGGAVETANFTDVHAASPFEVALDGTPPTDHFKEFVDGVSGAVEVPEVYLDLDHDAAYSETDSRAQGICRMGAPIALVYVSTVTSLQLAVQLVAAGNAPGWNAITIGAVEKFVPSVDAQALNSGPDCPLPYP